MMKGPASSTRRSLSEGEVLAGRKIRRSFKRLRFNNDELWVMDDGL